MKTSAQRTGPRAMMLAAAMAPALAQLPQLKHEDFFGGDGLTVSDPSRGIVTRKPDVVKTKLPAGVW